MAIFTPLRPATHHKVYPLCSDFRGHCLSRAAPDSETEMTLESGGEEGGVALGGGTKRRRSVKGEGAAGAAGAVNERKASGHSQFWTGGIACPNDETQRHSHLNVGVKSAVVHPKFLHANATSHTWPPGAIGELLDNCLDQNANGCTRIWIDVRDNATDGYMISIRDNGPGMTEAEMHMMMSFGVSTGQSNDGRIGQYGNGMKAGSMRIARTVLVLCKHKSGNRTAGLLSYLYHQGTGVQNVILPIVAWDQDWNILGEGRGPKESLRIIVNWGPFETAGQLKDAFGEIKHNTGTLILLDNLWEDENGQPELDLTTDTSDIICLGRHRQRSGKLPSVHRKKSDDSAEFNRTKYYGWQTSFRKYVEILYRALPKGFKIFLRGTEIIFRRLVIVVAVKLCY
jgi:hypothetical protein